MEYILWKFIESFFFEFRYKKEEGVRKGCPHFFCKSPNFRKLGLFY